MCVGGWRYCQNRDVVDVLQKLLDDEIRERSRKNVVQAREFSEALCAYINETAVPRKIVSNREGEGAASHV